MISYWDTSAIVPLIIAEENTEFVRSALESEGDIPKFTSWLTLFEMEMVFKRKLNQKFLGLPEYHAVQESWAQLQEIFNFIPLDNRVARGGSRLQKLYGLWTGDSVQLGSASVLQNTEAAVRFVCLDESLRRYARQEGFIITES